MSFQQGLSGLNATSRNLEVIGNNVANANTFGAKSSRAEFSDVYANALSGAGTSPIGIGTRMSAVAQQFTQGNITSTENPLDIAINGAGFFQVEDTQGAMLYTRNGQFKVDRDGFLVNNQKQTLLGYMADGQGTIIPSQAVPLQLPTAGIEPRATDRIDIEANLDSRAEITLPTSGALVDFADPSTYNNATSLAVYDMKGQAVALTYYFQKTGTDQWNVYATANGQSMVTDANGDPDPITTLTFPQDGGVPVIPNAPITLDIPSTTSVTGVTSEPITGVLFDLSGARQYGAGFSVTNLSQTGYAPGQLVGLQVGDDGVLTARYSNGQTKSAGQIELATFRNPQGLQPLGGNAWAATHGSGDPIVGTPASGNLGVLQAGALEESNVDLTGELVSMITAQRVYQANAQTIKTQDQVMQTLVNLR
jgi:flagellar hook protein FlgE